MITQSLSVCLSIYISSSSSCHATNTDFPDPLSPPISIVHRSREVFKATSCISAQLSYIGSSRSSCLFSSMWRRTQEYVAYEFVFTSPEWSCMSSSSNLDSFCDGCQVAVYLLFCWVLPPGLVQYCSQHSWVIAVKRLRLDSVHIVNPYSSINTTTVWKKKQRFILSVRSDFHITDSLLIAVHVACWCPSRLMRLCFLGRWTCPLVSENYLLVWRCHLFA